MQPVSNISQNTLGFFAGFTAFSVWGALVLYWKALQHIPADEILGYRMIFSMVATAPLVYIAHSWDDVLKVFKDTKTLRRIIFAAFMLGLNWLIYIWSVNNNKVVEASLGYFINPFLSVILGRIFLGEKMTRLQILAIAIAAFGVAFSVVAYGQFPFIGIILSFSFALYGYLRKTVNTCATAGFFVETLALFPISLSWIFWKHISGQGIFWTYDVKTQVLLAGTGIITALPLILFAYASKRIQLSTLGLLQYITPTITLFVGVFLYHEKISQATGVTLICVWLGLALYTWCCLRQKPIFSK